jgi:quercetin dioxygenase-like cupin family protein
LTKVRGEDTNGTLSALELTITPGSIVVPHTHSREDEVTFVLEGEIGARVGEHIVVAPAGSYVLKPRNIPHTFWNAGSRNARTLEMISPPAFGRYFEDLSGILKGGGSVDKLAEEELDRRYGLTNHPEWLPELVSKYRLTNPLSPK